MDADYRHRYIAPVTPDAVPDPPVRPASTVIVLRPLAGGGFQVLTVRRHRRAAFMGNARVFPGGALEDRDHAATEREVSWSGDPAELPWRAAALRELAEEAGVYLTTPADVRVPALGEDPYREVVGLGARFDAERLGYLSNWVTPKGLPRRFDTRFYVAVVDEGTEAAADQTEVFDAAWVEPAAALRRAERGDWEVEFPTRRHLEFLKGFRDCRDVLNYAKEQDQVIRIEPRIVRAGDGSWRVVVQGDPGYEEESR